MKLPLTLLTALFLATPAAELKTSYQSETKLRITISTDTESEVVDFRMERNGEPFEGRAGRMGGGSEVAQTVIYVDEMLAVVDGAPTEIRRYFEDLARESSSEDNTHESDAPLEGITLMLRAEDGEVEAELEDGSIDDALLEGHRMTFLLDAFLPEEEVEPGDSWPIDGEAIVRALGLDTQQIYFPRKEEEPSFDGERGGRGGRGGWGGRRSGRLGRLLGQADWDGTAILVEGEQIVDGDACRIIKLELSGTATLEEEDRGERRGFALGSVAPALETTTEFEIAWKGQMAFSAEALRPIALELEGTFSSEMEMERGREEMTMSIYRREEGNTTYLVSIENVQS